MLTLAHDMIFSFEGSELKQCMLACVCVQTIYAKALEHAHKTSCKCCDSFSSQNP